MEAYIGQICLFAGNFAPKGWALCNGQILPISQNTALYSILGVKYGGDGKVSFALPNLMGRTAMNQGTGSGLSPTTIGQLKGNATVTLNTTQIPHHTHQANAYNDTGDKTNPIGNVWASTKAGRASKKFYGITNTVQMSPQALYPAGGGLPHNNMQPFLGINYIICLQGIFPSRS